MKSLIVVCAACLLFSCRQSPKLTATEFQQLSKEYVRLALNIGMYDADFVDAYYGPDSLRPQSPKLGVFPKYIFLDAVLKLRDRVSDFEQADDPELSTRAKWMEGQLTAFARRIKIFSGDRAKFDVESKDLFGVVAPHHPESFFKERVSRLDKLLPGPGDIGSRFQQIANRFIVPKDKIDTVFKTAIAEARKRTLAHYRLPTNENFALEYVQGKPWSGYNWYKGNFQSLIQINTDTDIFIERAIDVASHESYPGHHVYNMLLEQELYKEKGWLEISLYPLFSPQSLIAEGSANYGIDVAFPGNEKVEFAAKQLLPAAGMDTLGIVEYFKALALKAELNFARNEVARGLVDGTMTEAEAMRWLMEYGLNNRETAAKSISFIRKYGSYVINYNYGLQLVKDYVESRGGTLTDPGKRWELFRHLLSNAITPADLQVEPEPTH